MDKGLVSVMDNTIGKLGKGHEYSSEKGENKSPVNLGNYIHTQ